MSTDPNAVVVSERVLDHGFVVDKRAGAGPEVSEDVAVPVLDDLGVEP